MNIRILKYDSSKHKSSLLKFYNSLSEEDRYKRFHGYFKDFEEYVNSLDGRQGVILLACDNDEIIGVCEAYPVSNEEWEVAIIVSRNYRKMGIGRRLLEEIAREVEKRGGKGLYGIVGRSNYEAIEFGRRVGCKVLDNDIYTVKIYFELCRLGEDVK